MLGPTWPNRLTPAGQVTATIGVGDLPWDVVVAADTKTAAVVGRLNLGGSKAQAADGYEPTGIALTKTPTPGS
jgi:hypothetical protein